ncbi:DUF6083 domain-containing protein [Streptomyces sp. NPDC002537]
MGDIDESPLCRQCLAAGGGVRDRGLPFGAVCDKCFVEVEAAADAEQALREGATAAGPPAEPVCPGCGCVQDRFPTGYGYWVLLERLVPLRVGEVPAGERWFIGRDGRAVNRDADGDADGAGLRTADSPCRFRHDLVCGNDPRPDGGLPEVFARIRRLNRLKGGSGYEGPPR